MSHPEKTKYITLKHSGVKLLSRKVYIYICTKYTASGLSQMTECFVHYCKYDCCPSNSAESNSTVLAYKPKLQLFVLNVKSQIVKKNVDCILKVMY